MIINDIEAKWLTNSEAFASSKTVLQRMAEQMMVLGVRDTVIIHEPKWAVAMNQQGEQVAIPSYWVENKIS